MFLIIAAYDFAMLLNTNCSHGEEVFETIEGAKAQCKIDDKCVGLFQKNCTDNQDYYKCLNSAARMTHSEIEGCFYMKYAISK